MLAADERGGTAFGTFLPTQAQDDPPAGLLIRFEPGLGPAAREAILAHVSGILGRPLGADGNLFHISIGTGLAAGRAAEILSGLPGVVYAAPNHVRTIELVSDDPYYLQGQLWGMYGDRSSPANQYGSQAAEAWAAGWVGAANVAVGVIDTGIDYTHPDLYLNIWINQAEIPAGLRASLSDVDGDAIVTFRDLNHAANAAHVTDTNGNGRIDAGDLLADPDWENGIDDDANGYVDDLVGWDFFNEDNDPFDDEGHGTHVAGTISATGGNGAGVAGMTWSTLLIPLKFIGANGTGTDDDAIRAIDWFTDMALASSDIRLVATNNSWGGDPFSQPLLEAIARGAQADILFVAAAGNGGWDGFGDDNDRFPHYPSNFDTTGLAGWDAVIAVASITSSGARSSFTNYGDESVDLGAPGSSILSTYPGGSYATASGTSMAAPHVTGAIALYAARNPTASGAEIRQDLLATTIATSSLAGRVVTGGRLDAYAFAADAAPVLLSGTPGVDWLIGGRRDDVLNLSQGGNDRVQGNAGDDGFYFGAALNAADDVDGGAGDDQLGIQGNYPGLTLGAANLVGVETLVLLSGSDSRFGDTAGNRYDYVITTVDANVPAGARLTVSFNTLLAGEDVTFDGSAETNGHFLTFAGLGADRITGGGQDDGFYFGAEGRWGAGDRVDGRGGTLDQLGLQGNYSGAQAIVFGADQLAGIEMIVLLSGGDARFGSGGLPYSYDLTMHDGNVPAGQVMIVTGNTLRVDEALSFDASAELDGAFIVYGGLGGDDLTGGAGDDQLWGRGGGDRLSGGRGADLLRGGDGHDSFIYFALAESTAASRDWIVDFAAGDSIDLSALDAIAGGGDDAFTFIGAAAFSNTPGELRASQSGADWLVEGDVDGDGIADLSILVSRTDAGAMVAGDFVL